MKGRLISACNILRDIAWARQRPFAILACFSWVLVSFIAARPHLSSVVFLFLSVVVCHGYGLGLLMGSTPVSSLLGLVGGVLS